MSGRRELAGGVGKKGGKEDLLDKRGERTRYLIQGRALGPRITPYWKETHEQEA